MIDVVFERDSRRRLSSVFATGHAQFGEHPNDVVCAAVSAILQAAYVGLTDVARLALPATPKPGELRIRIPAAARDRADVGAIVATAEISLRRLARQYPKHLRVRRKSGS